MGSASYDHCSVSGVGTGFFGSGGRKLFSPVMSPGAALWLCPLVRYVAILIRRERRDVDEDFDVASM